MALFGSVYDGPSLPGRKSLESRGTSPFSPLPNKTAQGDDPLDGSYKLFNSAVSQQAGDYDTIMQGYKNLLSSSAANSPALKPSGSYNPLTYEYNPTSNVVGAMSNLRGLSQSGGITDDEASDIRARGISPIRAVYAGANRDIDRNRVLRGGYSPGYQATKAKMAREMSSLLADKVTDVNADIASRRQSGRLSASNAYSSAAGAENALRAQYGRANVDTANDASKFNLQLPLEYGKYNQGLNSNTADILRGMSSLYGTTPAMSSLFGGQALDSARLQNNINQDNNQNFFRLLAGLR